MIKKLIKRTFLLGLIAQTGFISLHADLVWDRNTGWRAEGGLAEQVLGGSDGKNALELMNDARALQEDGSYFKALRVYEDVYEDYDRSIYAPEALFQSAKIHVERHQFDSANEDLARIIKLYPNYSKFNEVLGLQFELASQIMEGKRPYYFGIMPGFRNYEYAVDFFEDIVKHAPYSRYAPAALMNIALIAQHSGNTEDAIDALYRLTTNYPQSMLAADAYLNLAQTFSSLVDGAYYDQGSTREAISYYQDFIALFPDDGNIAVAEEGLKKMQDIHSKSKLLIGEFYFKSRNNKKAAMVFLNEAITTAPNSKSAERARQLIERINAGARPPSTPIDWMFGKRKAPSEGE